jgi:hypothetical protein
MGGPNPYRFAFYVPPAETVKYQNAICGADRDEDTGGSIELARQIENGGYGTGR